MKWIKAFYKLLISVFYPNTCLSCGEIIEEGEFLCYYCTEHLPLVNWDKLCRRCGLDKKNCQCNKRIFCFEGVTAPFYNSGSAQKAMYAFKLGKRRYISDYFANRMAINVKYVYHDIKFDGICYVPISPKSLRKRGFNQSRDIAERMSRLLQIPLIENALGSHDKKQGQHSAKGNKREANVKGAFYPKRRINGKILLIDDIKTTGSTLNECARQLLIAGADSVYCATGLVSKKRKKKG